METQRIVGWNVRRLRVLKKLTIEELADLSGVDAGYVAKIERGSANPTVSKVTMLARSLSVAPADLLIEPAIGTKPPKPLTAGRRAVQK